MLFQRVVRGLLGRLVGTHLKEHVLLLLLLLGVVGGVVGGVVALAQYYATIRLWFRHIECIVLL